jgi:hypothetical protein
MRALRRSSTEQVEQCTSKAVYMRTRTLSRLWLTMQDAVCALGHLAVDDASSCGHPLHAPWPDDALRP